MKRMHVFAAMALAGMLQIGAFANDGTEVTALRAEIDALRSEMNTGMTTGYDDAKKPAAAAPSGDCGCCGTGCCGSSCGCCSAPSCGCCEQSCGCCDNCGCCQGGWLFDAELTFLRFHREEGFNTDDVFDFEISPRFSLGYVGSNCLGVRASYWLYDHANNKEGLDAVDTWNLDVEGFTVTQLTCRTSVEWSAGIRYNDYISQIDGDLETFSGYGALLGVKLQHYLCNNISVYGRARWAIMMDDAIEGTNNREFDVVRTHEELAAGAQYTTCMGCYVVNVFGGYEFQDWTSYENGDASVGFGGFNFGVGIRR